MEVGAPDPGRQHLRDVADQHEPDALVVLAQLPELIGGQDCDAGLAAATDGGAPEFVGHESDLADHGAFAHLGHQFVGAGIDAEATAENQVDVRVPLELAHQCRGYPRERTNPATRSAKADIEPGAMISNPWVFFMGRPRVIGRAQSPLPAAQLASLPPRDKA